MRRRTAGVVAIASAALVVAAGGAVGASAKLSPRVAEVPDADGRVRHSASATPGGWVVYDTYTGKLRRAGHLALPKNGRWYVYDRHGAVFGYVFRSPNGRWQAYQASFQSHYFRVGFASLAGGGRWNLYDPGYTVDGRLASVGYVTVSPRGGWDVYDGFAKVGYVGGGPGGAVGAAAFLLFIPH